MHPKHPQSQKPLVDVLYNQFNELLLILGISDCQVRNTHKLSPVTYDEYITDYIYIFTPPQLISVFLPSGSCNAVV